MAKSAMFQALPEGKWVPIGLLNSHVQLHRGDEAQVRFYDEAGELPELTITHEILSDEDGDPHIWQRFLAEQINTYHSIVKAGKLADQGLILGYRSNLIYTVSHSGIQSAELILKREKATEPSQPEAVADDVNYDHIYPVNRKDYRAGDKVLHLGTGRVYQCKPWPYIEFCRLGGKMNEQYEPGVGKNWTLAWQELN